MKTILKRLFCVILSVILLMTLCISAFAVEDEGAPSYTIEGLMEAFRSGDQEMLADYFRFLGVEEETANLPAPRWTSDPDNQNTSKMSHDRITAYGYILYIADMITYFPNLHMEYLYSLYDMNRLITYSEMPDKTDIDIPFLFKSHFYSPITGNNYMGESRPTAKTRAEEYYALALQAWRQGNRELAMRNLGCTIHFLEDVNEPHHASNKIAGLTSQHDEFEKYVTADIVETISDAQWKNQGSPNADKYNWYRSHSIGQAVHEAATFGIQFVDSVEDTGVGKELRWMVAAWATVINAETCVSATLYKFAREAGLTKG